MGKIAVIADDITGANDIGVMFTKSGLSVNVYSKLALLENSDVSVFDTNSRFDKPETAYKKVYDASLYGKKQGITQFFKKTCSVFRGNIGSEFDAMLDAVGAENGMVVLGFPDNGRTTIHGVHYVNGIKLENTQFKNDPMNPMIESDLKSILQKQTQSNVDTIFYEELDKGYEHLCKIIAEKRKTARYLIFDVRNNSDLQKIANVICDEKMICGSSAIASYLKQFNKNTSRKLDYVSIPDKNKGKLIIAGSLTPQTIAQIDFARKNGVYCFEFDSMLSIDHENCELHMNELVFKASSCIEKGKTVLIHTSNETEKIKKTKEQWFAVGHDEAAASKQLSLRLSDIAKKIINTTGQFRLVVAGGDTSGSFCEKMHIGGIRIFREIQTGIPSGFTIEDNPKWLILKSGSFGSEDFFIRCLHHLNEEE